jgi:O-methyltransferase
VAIIDRIRQVLRRWGYDLTRVRECPVDFDEPTRDVYRLVRPYTMTSPERVAALIAAVRYVVERGIPGDIVECGVWRGGSMMAAAHTLKSLGDQDRTLHLFDTFEGMPDPTDRDRRYDGRPASEFLANRGRDDLYWASCSVEDVQANMGLIGYQGAVRYIEGRVEETIPREAPERIALLRLDTDWYASTKHELEQLYDRVTPGGVLIVDDYGWWQGSRQAVDEFLAERKLSILLHRIDTSGRVAIVPER